MGYPMRIELTCGLARNVWKIRRVTLMAVNRPTSMPRSRVTAKPRIGPLPNWKRTDRRDARGDQRVTDGSPGPIIAALDCGADGLAQRQLLADAFEDQHVVVHGDGHGQHDPGNAGQAEREAEIGHQGEQDDEVEDQREVGHQAGEAVVDDHEDEDEGGGQSRRGEAGLDRVFAHRRPDRAFFDDVDGRGQGAGAQDDGQVLRFVDAEVAGDRGAATADALADDRRRIDGVVENDRHPLADIVCRQVVEQLRTTGVELEGNVRTLHLRRRPHQARRRSCHRS